MSSLRSLALPRAAVWLLPLAVWLGGCSKKIGDPCILTADCGMQANRVCDTAQENGYCTQMGCSADGCPSEASCFLFQARMAGCAYQDRQPSRLSRSFCMLSCDDDSDCRDGYTCADVTGEPWGAVLLDLEERRPKACIVAATFQDPALAATDGEPEICASSAPAASASEGEEPAAP